MSNDITCPRCGGSMKHYDTVTRIVRSKNRKTDWVRVERLRCSACARIRRNLPDYILPYKQYDADIIRGVVEGLITCETLGYEDYPCEMTMKRWRTRNSTDFVFTSVHF